MASCGNYKIHKRLGLGGNSEVYLASLPDTDQYVALKLMMRDALITTTQMMFQNEVERMQELNHDHIIKLIAYSNDAQLVRRDGNVLDVWYLALELAQGGQLFDYVAETGAFSENLARYFFKQIISALEYLHINGVSHRDLKLQNILLDADYNIKIADFGFASIKPLNESDKGTDGLKAPEILKGEEYNGHWADLFALGVWLFWMVTQRPPFFHATPKDAKYATIYTNKHELFWKFHTKRFDDGVDHFSKDLRTLIQSMIAFNPHERPSITEIKSHEWFNGPVPTYEEVKIELDERYALLVESRDQSNEPLPQTTDPNVFTGTTVHRSFSDEDFKLDETPRKTGVYYSDCRRCTEFFSKSSPLELSRVIAHYANDYAKSVKFDDYEYTAYLEVKHEEITVKFQISILEVDKETHWIEVIKEKGDIFVFSDIYHKIKEYFGGHVNSNV